MCEIVKEKMPRLSDVGGKNRGGKERGMYAEKEYLALKGRSKWGLESICALSRPASI